MNQSREEQKTWVKQAMEGDKQALETLLSDIQDDVFNLSLRMLGTLPDAQDATQEILVRVMTGLLSFRGDSAFSTWVYAIAVNHLRDCRKTMFAQHPLSFEAYGEDILHGKTDDLPDLSQGVDRLLLEEELKLSCTNVMLQCLAPLDRCIFILGTMFRADSRVAGDILGMTPEAYRQRLSRARGTMGDFLKVYCGLGGGVCRCKKRVDFAIATHRLHPDHLDYSALDETQREHAVTKEAMEGLDDLSLVFSTLPSYRCPEKAKDFLKELLHSERLLTVQGAGGGAEG